MITNDFKVADLIQNLDNNQLQMLMSSPPPGVPMYLIMSEAQRRQQAMQQAMAQNQQPAPQTTVADDLRMGIAGTPQMAQGGLPADDPQGSMGLGSFAQPPQPQMPPQGGMPQAGMPQQPVQQFAKGGEVDDLPNRYSVWDGSTAMEQRLKKRGEEARKNKGEAAESRKKLLEKVDDVLRYDPINGVKQERKAPPQDLSDYLNRYAVREINAIRGKEDQHVPATIPAARAQDAAAAKSSDIEWKVDLPIVDSPNPFSVPAGAGSTRAVTPRRPSIATPPYNPVPASDGREWKYTPVDLTGMEIPSMPTMPEDEEYISRAQEMFPSTLFDEHMGNVDEKLGGMDAERREAGARALMRAGLATLAGKGNSAQNIGQGFLEGFDTFTSGQDAVREREEALQARREALQMAKLEYERGNVETGMKWADRARNIELQLHELERGQYDMQMDQRKLAADEANRQTAFDRDVYVQDRNHMQQERQFAAQHERMRANAANRAGLGSTGAGNSSMQRHADNKFQQLLAQQMRNVSTIDRIEDPEGAEQEAQEKATRLFVEYYPHLVEYLPHLSGAGGGAAGGAPSSSPDFIMDDEGNIFN